MTTKELLIGETRHFTLFPKNDSTIIGFDATWELHSLLNDTLTGTPVKDINNTNFMVTVPTVSLKEGLYELRVFVTYPDNSLRVCVYKEKLNLKS